MHALHQCRQRFRPGWHENKVDMIGHQAPRPAGHAKGAGMPRQQVEIEGIIGIVEKRLLPPIATLGHVVGQAGKDDAGGARHAGILAGDLLNCNVYV